MARTTWHLHHRARAFCMSWLVAWGWLLPQTPARVIVVPVVSFTVGGSARIRALTCRHACGRGQPGPLPATGAGDTVPDGAGEAGRGLATGAGW